MWTVSAFQQHPRTIIICDEDATLELRVKTVKYFKVCISNSGITGTSKTIFINTFQYLSIFKFELMYCLATVFSMNVYDI